MRSFKEMNFRKDTLFVRAAVVVLVLSVAIGLMTQAVFAQNTYVITDGDRVFVHTTYATDPAAILNEAGLSLGKDDTYTTQEGDGVSAITVKRIQMVHVDDGGEKLVTGTYGETVESLLTRLNVSLEGNVTVSEPLNAQTYDGMEITVHHTVLNTETYSRVIPFETEYCYDASVPEGKQVVLVEGRDGQMQCTAQVSYEDGVEVARDLISQTVIDAPVNALVATGTLKEDQVQEPAPYTIEGNYITLSTGEVLRFREMRIMEATAYSCGEQTGLTALGTTARVGAIAVDPTVIPYGTRVFIVSCDGEYIYGVATAEDCGGLIIGDRIDLYMETVAECFVFGRRDVRMYILG